MIVNLVKTLLVSPESGWQRIRDAGLSTGDIYRRLVLPLALVPVVCAFIGTTRIGWLVGTGDPVRLTTDSALKMAVLSYIAILVAVFFIGKLIHWMGQTYDADQPLSRCIALAAFTASPLLLVGIAQLYPPLWFIFIIGLPALCYSVYLLYTGVPVMMEVSKDRGFLFSSSILAVGLVCLVGLLAATVSLWGFGFGPRFAI